MQKSRSIRLFISLVFVAPFVAYGLVNFFEDRWVSLPFYEKVSDEKGDRVGHQTSFFKLVNQQGEQVSNENWTDKIVVANLFFSHCPVICPTMMKQLCRVQEAFRSNNHVLLCSFSVDPERDSVTRLKRYSEIFHIDPFRWHLLTGDKRVIYRFARNDLMVVATDSDGGPDDFIHSDKIVLLDPRGRVRGYYDGTAETGINKLIRDIKKLDHEK